MMDGRARNLANGPSSTRGVAPGMTRAERFDDERRRITESCFAKVDDQGQLQESYITHIRVQEDGAYPQYPPPPSSPATNKKARIIIVSVRNTGRVKLHKARENANGTFSIGKTWPMEDLSALENFVNMMPSNEDEAARKQWAGDRGFTVTITKPYYWEAGTPKEKEFFIGSIIKIYNKYTKGEFPTLTGFSTAELDNLTNGQAHLATAQSRPTFNSGGRERSSPASNLNRQDSSELRQPSKSPRRAGDAPFANPGEMKRGPSPGINPHFRRNAGDYQGLRRPGHPDDQLRNGNRPGTGDDSRRPSPFSQTPSTSSVPDFVQKQSMEQGLLARPGGENTKVYMAQGREPIPPTPSFPPQIPISQSSISDYLGGSKTPESGSLLSSLSTDLGVIGQDAQSQRSQKPSKDQSEGEEPSSPRFGISSEGYGPDVPSTEDSASMRKEDMYSDEPTQRKRPLMESKVSQMSEYSVDYQDSEPRNAFNLTAQSSTAPIIEAPSKESRDFFDKSETATKEIPKHLKAAVASTEILPSSPPRRVSLGSALHQSQLDETTSPTQSISAEAGSIKSLDESIESAENKEAYRPGLGPMIKQTMVTSNAVDRFRKAAAAANVLKSKAGGVAAGAFKPRAGGAAAKLFNKEIQRTNEADGVNAVFVPQRPIVKDSPKDEPDKTTERMPKLVSDILLKDRSAANTETIPAVVVSSPLSPAQVGTDLEQEDQAIPPVSNTVKLKKGEAEQENRRKKRRSNQQVKNITRLGIDPTIIDERGLEFEALLSELDWIGHGLSAKSVESLEADIKREIARVEAGSWLNHLEQKDDRVEAVEGILDRAIAECDELEGLLTLYNVELSSLNDDIAFIEAQSQGLQVQTANQRLLKHELQQLVETISITSDQLEPLRRSPIGKVNGLSDIEKSLVLLYKALLTIDPSFVVSNRSSTVQSMDRRSALENGDLVTMRALQEKRDNYLSEGANFLARLQKHMEITFGAAFLSTKDALATIDQSVMPSLKKNIEAHDAGRSELWMLSPVMLFAKEIDRNAWNSLLRMYQAQASLSYQQEVRDNILAWRKFARKPTGEEQELLFTAQEKEIESIAGTARKLTVKRSQTLARGLRVTSGEKESKDPRPSQDGKLYAYDVFARVLDETGPVLLTEQNFVTEFFHATSTDSIDFPESVQMALPEARRAPNLWIRKQFEADRTMAKLVTGVMEEIFSFWPTEIQSLVEWAVQADPLQGVGILGIVDRKLLDVEDSNQDFLTRNLQKIHERLQGLFNRFLDEQIRAIEETKVKIKKRKGVISFMKIFPHFAIAIENMLPSAQESGDQLEIRRMVNDAYQRINKAMFESLKVIAKDSPTVMTSQGQGDPEDKEALNYHILLIENMNHYMGEVDAQTDSVLQFWKSKAQDEYNEHMGLYVDAVIRRPLGKLLEFIESTETLLSQPGSSPQSLTQRSSHSRSTFKRLAHSNDAKEIRKGIEALKKRVDKHFGDADDPTISKDLVFKVLKECEKKYVSVSERMTTISQDVYGGEVEVDWGSSEISAALRR